MCSHARRTGVRCQMRAANMASTSLAAPKRTGSSAGRPVSASAAAIAARASSSASARVLSATATTRAGRAGSASRSCSSTSSAAAESGAGRRRRPRSPSAPPRGRGRAGAERAVVEPERHAGVDRMDERALALDPEELAAALGPLDDEPLGGAGDEVRDDGVDRDPPARDRDARLAGRDEYGARGRAAAPRGRARARRSSSRSRSRSRP